MEATAMEACFVVVLMCKLRMLIPTWKVCFIMRRIMPRCVVKDGTLVISVDKMFQIFNCPGELVRNNGSFGKQVMFIL